MAIDMASDGAYLHDSVCTGLATERALPVALGSIPTSRNTLFGRLAQGPARPGSGCSGTCRRAPPVPDCPLTFVPA